MTTPSRALTTSLSIAFSVLLGGLIGAAPASAAPTPKPAPLPAAQSWVGGQELIGTRQLTALDPGTPAPPAPKAAAWLVADLDSREILAARRVHVPLAPASTMKIFTSLALAPRLDVRKVYTARRDDAAIDGTKVGLVPGSRYTVDQLLRDDVDPEAGAVDGDRLAIAVDDPPAARWDRDQLDPVALAQELVLLVLGDR